MQFYPVRPGQGLPDGRGGVDERELVGRVVRKGFEDELKASRWYAVVETASGSTYYLRLSDYQAEATREGDLVAFQTRREAAVRPVDRHIAEVVGACEGIYAVAGDGLGRKDAAARTAPARLRQLAAQGLAAERVPGQWAVVPDLLAQLEQRAPSTPRYRLSIQTVPLSLDAQVHHAGSVWLDTVDTREAAVIGFGAQVREAIARRREFVRRELSIDPDDPRRVAKLEEVDRRALGRTLEGKVGQTFRENLAPGFAG